MILPETKEIDGVLFEVKGLDLRTEREMFVRLTKLMGPAITTFVRAGKDPVAGMSKFLEVVENADLDFIIDRFMKVSSVRIETARSDGKESFMPATESSFKNGIGSQMKWLWFCLMHQYASFLGGEGATWLQALQAKASE